MKKVFIHVNNKQYLGAVIAKYAIEKKLVDKNSVQVEIINVDDLDIFKKFAGKEYLRSGAPVMYDPKDLQSFTLSRFMPPELMNFSGKAIVIDPDIFTLVDINELFDMDMKGKAIAACSKKDAWDTSVMLMDCQKLKHWKIGDIFTCLENKTCDYMDWMTLKKDKENVIEIPRIWNSLDILNDETKMLHTTNRLTQPWKTGLPIDFTRNKMPKLFGIIPREPIHKLLGKYPTHYLPHPGKHIEEFFFGLVKGAISDGIITKGDIQKEIDLKNIRQDALSLVA